MQTKVQQDARQARWTASVKHGCAKAMQTVQQDAFKVVLSLPCCTSILHQATTFKHKSKSAKPQTHEAMPDSARRQAREVMQEQCANREKTK